MSVHEATEIPESEGGGRTFGAPPRLFHYTSPAGLRGILKKGDLHCTSIHFLNDRDELRYVVEDLALPRLKQRLEAFEARDEGVGGEYAELVKGLIARAKGLLDTRIFIFALSRHPNQLSQWRAYCPASGGYSLGFDSRQLLRLADAQDFELVRCIYREDHQEDAVERVIEEAIEGYRSARREGEGISGGLWRRHCVNFQTEFFLLAARIKKPEFSNEEEWRLVSGPYAANKSEIHFREESSTLVPYIKFGLTEGDDEDPVPVSRVWIGPTPDSDLAERAVKELLDIYGAVGADVRVSEIPLRTF